MTTKHSAIVTVTRHPGAVLWTLVQLDGRTVERGAAVESLLSGYEVEDLGDAVYAASEKHALATVLDVRF